MSLTNANIVVNCDENEIKSSKRRYTLNNNNSNNFAGGRYNNKRKRRHDIVLPTRFLLGGNITDPLNLASFSGEIDQVTPESSPLPTPKHKKEVEVLIPVNLSDPLNLKSTDPEAVSTIPVSKIIKSRKRKRKRTDSETTIDDEISLPGPSGLDINCGGGTSISGGNPSGNADLSRAGGSSKLHDSSLEKESTKESSSTGLVNGLAGAEKVQESTKDDEKSASTRTSNSHHHHHHSRSSHHRFSRGSHHHQPYHHRNRNRHHQHHQQQTQHKFRAKDVRFQYGNYNRYYGYRNQNLSIDPRLRFFKSEWFENQDILDIGCNVGHVTLTIARDFNPKKIIGIDIDENLIKAANRNIKHYYNSYQGPLRKRLDTDVISKHDCDKLDSGKSSPTITKVSIAEKKDENSAGTSEIIISDKLNDKTDGDSQDCSNQRGEVDLQEEKMETVDQSKSDESPESLTPVCTESSKNGITISSQLSSALPSSSPPTQPPQSIISIKPDKSIEENLTNQLPSKETNDDQSISAPQPQPPKRNKYEFCKSTIFPYNVEFFCQNYVLDSDDLLQQEKPQFDCILCLSVTKWIHLNFGDEGLKRVFKRMYSQLRPGGKLILEAQPWCSYKKKKFISEFTLKNYWLIKFKPDLFNEFLLSKEVGFSTLELIDTPAHESKGFRRPIFLFRKAKESS